MQKVGVVGAGTMGIGVSHLFAAGGLEVVLVDVAQKALDRAEREIERNARLYRMIDPGYRVDPRKILPQISFTTDLGALADADFVVENVTENWDIKAKVYRQLDEICMPDCLFGVNTSAIPITKVAGHTSRAPQVIGTHFMNPAPVKPLVEVIRGFHTSESAIEATQALIRAAGKDSVVVNDSPGFVTNRVAMMTVNEACRLVEEGVAPAAEIDRLFVDCFGHRMGPLATADLIGLDTVLYSLEVLHEHFRDSKFNPSLLLARLVDAGYWGRKSGRGFFIYDDHLQAEEQPA